MSSSLFLTNWLFCGIAAWILASLLQSPHALTNKNKYPILFLLFAVSVKLLIPFEYSFTVTLRSRYILTFTRDFEQYMLFDLISIKSAIILLWLGVSTLILSYFIYRHLRLKRLLRHFHASAEPSILALTNRLCQEENIRKVPTVLQINSINGPFVFGIIHPTIVLPKKISPEELKIVLLHELQHIKYGHLYIKLLANFIFILHWWFPVVWRLNTLLSQALEYQVDNLVTKKLSQPESIRYMESMIRFAKSGYAHAHVLAPLSFADNQAMLKNRLLAIHSHLKKCSKHALSHLQKASIIVAFLLLLFPAFYNFEAFYDPSPEELDGAVSITTENSYFIQEKNGTYVLFVDKNYYGTFDKIPKSLKDIEILQLPY